MKTVYVIGDDVTDREPEFRSKGYRVVNCDIDGMISPELLPMRIGMLIKADFIFLNKAWNDNPIYRSEYAVALEFEKKFMCNIAQEVDVVVHGHHEEFIREVSGRVCSLYAGKDMAEIFLPKSARKNFDRVIVKLVVFYVLKGVYGLSVRHIHNTIPNVTRCDVYHGVKTIYGYMSVDKHFKEKIDRLTGYLYNSGYVNRYVYSERDKSYKIDDNSPIFSDVTPSTI